MAAYLKKSLTRSLLALALVALLTASTSAAPKIPPEMIGQAIRRFAQYAGSTSR